MELNIAFAGFRHGHIFDLYAKVQKHDNVHLLGAWENDAATRESLKDRVDFNYPTYEALLADDRVNVVGIGDYFGARGNLAIRALKAGKHVIVDKPLCTSLEELDEIEALAKEKRLSVHCMLSMRYDANPATLREIVRSGQLGEIRQVYFGGQHPLNYGSRASWYFEEGKQGGTINDIGIHGIDLLDYAMGLRLGEVLSARCWNAYAKECSFFNDSAQFMLKMDNGAGVIADVSYAALSSQSLPTYWLFMVWGEKGMCRFANSTPDVELFLEGAKQPMHVSAAAPAADYFTALEDELEGRRGILTTDETIRSTRAALTVQYASGTH